MKAQDVVKGQTIKGQGVVTAVHNGYNTTHFILKGGKTFNANKNAELSTLPARDAKGRFMARVHLVLSYCEELGDVVTTHLGIKAAKRAVQIHNEIWPGSSAVIA